MSYTNALEIFFSRLNFKHRIKGESFRKLSHSELDVIILDEIKEWKASIPSSHDEMVELADIMVACVLKLEAITEREQ